MLRTAATDRITLAPQSRSLFAYLYLLRVPFVFGAIFVTLPYLALRSSVAPLLIGLFDVRGAAGLWTISTSAFMLALTIMTTWFLVAAYADDRCGTRSIAVDYPIHGTWYLAASALAVPTLTAVYVVGGPPLGSLILWALAGWVTALVIYTSARLLVMQLDRFALIRRLAGWLAKHPELAAGYVDRDKAQFLPGHRFALSLSGLSVVLYVVIGRRMGEQESFVPTLAYALLLFMILCWAMGAVAFFLDRYRVPSALPLALLVVATGFSGGSDHYFQLVPSWTTLPVTPAAALTAHPPGASGPTSVIVVAANGGGIQAAAWTARVLTGLEEQCRATLGERCRFAESIKLISAVSGGSVGAMYVANAYQNGTLPPNVELARTRDHAERSSLEHVGWGLLYRDLFRPLYPHFDYDDRGSALEWAWQRGVDLSAPLESWRDEVRAGLRPATIFNATISDSGERLLMGTANPPEAPGRRNFEQLFLSRDVSIATAARLSAAFTYVSPAARADNDEEDSIHFVDGGYYDTYGVASLVDWLDNALRANQESFDAKISRVLVLQLRGGPPDRQRKGKRRGWFYQVYAPLSAILGARDTGQLARNDEEISLLSRAWQGRVSISTAVFQFCGGSPPLSWHMTGPQKQAIEDEWKSEQAFKTTRAVLEFLTTTRPDTVMPVPPPVAIDARCTATPAKTQNGP